MIEKKKKLMWKLSYVDLENFKNRGLMGHAAFLHYLNALVTSYEVRVCWMVEEPQQ